MMSAEGAVRARALELLANDAETLDKLGLSFVKDDFIERGILATA